MGNMMGQTTGPPSQPQMVSGPGMISQAPQQPMIPQQPIQIQATYSNQPQQPQNIV